jgi:glycosyltransferase involved in cell wall biosynthesis
MECMASGTPLLTTKLPGMPADYYPFVYFFDDESVEGMKEAFLRVLNYTEDELNDKGMDARQFVLKYKNNKIQAKKLIEFIESLMI